MQVDSDLLSVFTFSVYQHVHRFINRDLFTVDAIWLPVPLVELVIGSVATTVNITLSIPV